MQRIMIYFCLMFVFSFAASAQLKDDAQANQVEVRLGDVMSALEYNYFEMEKLAQDPVKNKEHLKSKVLQMQDNFNKVKSLNKNKALEKPLAELKKHLKDLEKAADADNKDEIRRIEGRLFLTCFQCHNTHR